MSTLKWPHRPHPRHVGAIVEHQVKSWALKQAQHKNASLEQWPVVTISGESGTEKEELGQALAERLGYISWGHEILTELARLLHTDEAAVAAFDKDTRIAIVDLLGSSAFNQEVVADSYAAHLRRIVESIARRGRAVLVGRGSQYMVDPLRALRVRLVAPPELRARAVEKREAISFEAAKELVSSRDSERAAFVLDAMGKDISDPTDYDVLVNTGTYARERAVGLVVMAYLAKFGELPLTTEEQKKELPLAPVPTHLPAAD
jgi:CMP/dCMP kinase